MSKASKSKAAALTDDAAHVLVVDDDKKIRDLLSRFLFESGFRVTSASDAESARAAMRGLTFDLVLLDVMMPGDSGLVLARELKSTLDVPIILLTARADTEDRIEGLETGADDYLPKPFEPRELVLRIQNILRRGAASKTALDEVQLGDYTFFIARGELKKKDQSVRLTERERELLRQFAQRPGTTVPRHELCQDESTGSERAIDVQINRLRRKIEVDPSNPVYLQTVRGKGYILHID